MSNLKTETETANKAGLRLEASFCRICTGGCGVKVTIDANDRIVDIRGDHDNPMTHGYACYKGLQAKEAHHGPARLLHALKRMADGSYERIPAEQALDEIGERMKAIIERDGPDAFALFCGNPSMISPINLTMQFGFMAALASRQRFTTMTIDQSAKYVSFDRLGGWAGGVQQFEESDVLMLFGSNPLISHATISSLCVDPVKRIKEAQARGLNVIVVDPRLTETARFAKVFLQPLPGHDAAIAAAMLRLILAEGWQDRDFCRRFVGAGGMAALRNAVEPYAAEKIEQQAGLKSGDIRAAADLFARSRKGIAVTGTGPSMAPSSNVMQHLVDCLNVVCGRFPRAGDKVVAVDVLTPPVELREEVIPPPRSCRAFPPSRIRGTGMLFGERLTATLADEILTPGAGQIKCMLVDAGNPATMVPDQEKIVAALKSLELLVTIDPCMTTTARLSHYVLPPLLHYERADLPISFPGLAFWPVAYSQYTKALIPPPPNSDLVDSCHVYWALAKRLGKTIVFDGSHALDMTTPPTTDELIDIRASRSIVPLDEIKKYPSGKIFPHNYQILSARPEANAKFDVMPEDVAAELAAERQRREQGSVNAGKWFSHFLVSRRMRDFYNGTGVNQETVRKRNPINPAQMNPADISALALREGDEIEIESDNGSIRAVLKADPALRSGVISLSHGWGGLPEEAANWRQAGSPVNRLISDRHPIEAVNAMPRMSAIPVNIRRMDNGGLK